MAACCFRAMSTSSSLKSWPTEAEWAKRQEAMAALTARKLGVAPKRAVYGSIGASKTLDILGREAFAEVSATRIPGRVLWCNFELARELGFDVPPLNRMTPEFHEQLLNAFSYRTVRTRAEMNGAKTITMYADRYGGDGVRPAMGAARAGFLPFGNLYIKGIGFTPLFRDDPDDFAHNHGGVHMSDCLSEAVFGEVNQNLFTHGSTRIIAIIDQGKDVTPPSGPRIPIALVVRAGTQLRPGHLLTRSSRTGSSLLEKFVRMTTATGQLVKRRNAATGNEIPNLRATMLRVIDDHARTAAEQLRWRMIHGALSSSNMELSGAQLDLPTQSAQSRTAPVWALDFPNSVFGREHIERANQLTPVYRKLLKSIPAPQRPILNAKGLNLRGEMDRAYYKHLQVKLLCAVGLKTGVAQRMQAEQTELVSRFINLLLKMIELRNPGSVCISKSLVESTSALDVFHLLEKFPQTYFADPNADHTKRIRRFLKPILKGNRYHVAKKDVDIRVLVKEFDGLYRELMHACEGYAGQYYGDRARMQASIKSRAAFENKPLEALYAKRLHEELNRAIAQYKATGDVDIIRAAIDQRILSSLRSVDALLAQGKSRLINGGGIEMEMRTIDGVSYSVRAWNDERQTRRLHVRLPADREHGAYLTSLPNLSRLTRRQIQSLRYRFTTDGWMNTGEARARLAQDESGNLSIAFEILTFPLVGQLEGAFYLCGSSDPRSADETPRFGGYIFAIPDREELIKLVARP